MRSEARHATAWDRQRSRVTPVLRPLAGKFRVVTRLDCRVGAIEGNLDVGQHRCQHAALVIHTALCRSSGWRERPWRSGNQQHAMKGGRITLDFLLIKRHRGLSCCLLAAGGVADKRR